MPRNLLGRTTLVILFCITARSVTAKDGSRNATDNHFSVSLVDTCGFNSDGKALFEARHVAAQNIKPSPSAARKKSCERNANSKIASPANTVLFKNDPTVGYEVDFFTKSQGYKCGAYYTGTYFCPDVPMGMSVTDCLAQNFNCYNCKSLITNPTVKPSYGFYASIGNDKNGHLDYNHMHYKGDDNQWAKNGKNSYKEIDTPYSCKP